ncbi:MAG: glycine-rich protein [Janthinobacterium lividum]
MRVTRIQVVATGAAGGQYVASTVYSPGAQVAATLSVTPGEVLLVMVGGQGRSGNDTNAGGYNGGGSGSGRAGGGGGATELRRDTVDGITDDYLRRRNALLVAGAAGGSDGAGAVGGVGGTPIGGTGVANNVGIGGGGATQSTAGGTGSLAGMNNQGGTGNLGGGGGGGYYGGGGGAPSSGSAGGGGGSSWVTTIGSSAISYSQGPEGGDGALTITPVVDPLPVHLVDFTAQAQGTGVALTWHTASEANSDYFAVERSLNGTTFTTLGIVANPGTTNQVQAYAYRDTLLPAGARLLYYRLRLIDRDGTATYSPVRPVHVALGGLTLFPNPTATHATLTGAAATTTVHVLDALGREVFATSTDATGTAPLTLPTTLPSGVYLVRAGQQAVRLTVE